MDFTSTSCLGANRASDDVEMCSTSNQRWRQPLEETNSHQLRFRLSNISILLSCSEASLRFNVYISIGLAFEIKDDLSINQSNQSINQSNNQTRLLIPKVQRKNLHTQQE